MLRHGKVELALHHLRGATAAGGRPLLILHGLGEASPRTVPTWADAWPGPIAALDFTGHGASTVPRGGGYTAELLLGDADAALGRAHRRATRLVRSRWSVAAWARTSRSRSPAPVRLRYTARSSLDGPGLAGGPTGPTSQSFFSLPTSGATPDPYALVELGRDLRPPDYAALFVRLALAGSDLDEPIAVAAVFRPEWLDAVVRELGVVDVTLGEALSMYAG